MSPFSPEIQKLAKILRSSDEIVAHVGKAMEKVSGKKGVLGSLVKENTERVQEELAVLGLDSKASAEDVYEKLLARVRDTDEKLTAFLGRPDPNSEMGARTITQAIFDIVEPKAGFYLKRETAEGLLRKNPPRHLLQILGHSSVDEAIEQEGLFSVFSSVRFAERKEWLNDVFFSAYEHLTPDDFEQREVSIIVLPERWREIGKQFVGKKLHHISHLKELGVVFVIPASEQGGLAMPEFGEGYQVSGGVLEIFTLVLHYLFEVPFYADVFEQYSKGDNFVAKFVSALRGDVIGLLPLRHKTIQWRIIQRYLAKDNVSDPRLSEPHINPEALHWSKAEAKLRELGDRHPEFGFSFWANNDDVGDFFPTRKDAHGEVLLSFDLIDNMISLRRSETVISKYLYHQEEALWNRIFSAYMGGDEKMEEYMKKNLYQGYLEL